MTRLVLTDATLLDGEHGPQRGATVVVDASQAVPQFPVDVSTLGADMLVFTGHKAVGPTGIGYTLESLQGLTLQAELLYRNGYPGAWGWSSSALQRVGPVPGPGRHE